MGSLDTLVKDFRVFVFKKQAMAWQPNEKGGNFILKS
jgi:hypothetical protein